ncbi:hypothetical protein [Saccharibacillus deserti]|uniref:hypothetical protein n=1 Tax=Saccharibacillus deserti TaxID=1634444 RepID=UPI0015532276|nr:hypothetical protein [Saccharibacillus deserti]
MKRMILICFITAACMLSATACQSKKIPDKSDNKTEITEVEQSINENLDIITSNKDTSFSSNPSDYINANRKLYEEIINTGDKGFEFYLKSLSKVLMMD